MTGEGCYPGEDKTFRGKIRRNSLNTGGNPPPFLKVDGFSIAPTPFGRTF